MSREISFRLVISWKILLKSSVYDLHIVKLLTFYISMTQLSHHHNVVQIWYLKQLEQI